MLESSLISFSGIGAHTNHDVFYLLWDSHTWSHLDLTINDQVPPPGYATTYQETYDELINNLVCSVKAIPTDQHV